MRSISLPSQALRPAQCGQALVELALVLPVLLLLLLGLIDFGRAYVAGIAIESAAREGARLAADWTQSHPSPPAQDPVLARVRQAAQPLALQDPDITVCVAQVTPPAAVPACPASGSKTWPSAAGADSGKAVTVTVVTNVPLYTSFLIGRLGFSSIPITSSATMVLW